jgi:hypothetical protein
MARRRRLQRGGGGSETPRPQRCFQNRDRARLRRRHTGIVAIAEWGPREAKQAPIVLSPAVGRAAGKFISNVFLMIHTGNRWPLVHLCAPPLARMEMNMKTFIQTYRDLRVLADQPRLLALTNALRALLGRSMRHQHAQ